MLASTSQLSQFVIEVPHEFVRSAFPSSHFRDRIMASTSSSGSASLLPTGYLSTQGSQIVDASGNPVRIASIGWNQGFDN
ncbi:MAG: hypothetical protein J0H35_14060, partial [Rhodospirillales bacterium]|nr:hypothetical protein [Rhodospirillales bacterium]